MTEVTQNRIQLFKTFEQNNLSLAAFFLFEDRSRAGEFDLDFFAKQKKKSGEGKYFAVLESFTR